jgi:hypothetical protein
MSVAAVRARQPHRCRSLYRKAKAGKLRTIAPKRFNPTGEACLPVLHTMRGNWRFTALNSNAPTAHELGKTNEWVGVYFQLEPEPESQCTVVTETRAPLVGHRCARSRSGMCGSFLQVWLR